MKNIFTFLLILLSYFSYAQNVGIGVRDPKNTLHVAGGLRVDSLSTKKDSGLVLHNVQGDLISVPLTGNTTDVLTGAGTFESIAAATGAWLVTGNAGTDSNTNFLGTTDNQPLVIRVNNLPFGKLKENIQLGFHFNTFGTGRDNVAIGNNVMNNISSPLDGPFSASRNVAVGFGTLGLISDGQMNVAVGYNASGLGAGNQNVAIGPYAAHGVFGDRNIAIGSGAMFSFDPAYSSTPNDNIAIGNSALGNLANGHNNLAIGNSALYKNKHVSYGTAIGWGAQYSVEAGEGTVSVGPYTLYNALYTYRNTVIGYEALKGGQPDISAAAHVAVGYQSLYSNTSGSSSTAIGYQTLTKNTTGNHNVAAGYQALLNNTTGSANVASGASALFNNTVGAYNTAYGTESLNKNVHGLYNTAAGNAALYNSKANGNSAFGFKSLLSNVSGTYNTALGFGADVTLAYLVNATAIGYNAKVNASNKVRIGNASVTKIEGQVPFSTPSDGRYKFNVKEDVKGLSFILKLRPVSYQFDVNRFDDNAAEPTSNIIQASYTAASEIRRTGFIAQEVEAAAMKADYNFSGIIQPESSTDHYSLSYEAFVVPLVKSIQEQQMIIDELRKEIKTLQQEMKVIQSRVK